MSVQTDAPGATEEARDPWQAALEQVNTEQGFGPAAVADQPVPAEAAAPEGPTGTDEERTPTRAADASPDQDTDPVRRLEREIASLRGNLQQQRAHFEQQQAQREAAAEARGKAQAAAEVDQRARDDAAKLVSERAAQRAEVDRRLALTADPDARQQLTDYRAQLDQADSAHYQAELTRERDRATTAEQAAQQVVYRAQTERVAALLPQLLPQYAPHIALALAQRGQEATEDEVRAILAKPEYIREAQAATYQGKQAMDIFGQVLTTAVGNELSMARQHAQQQAQGRRAERDASGLGRAAQAGNGAGEPPEDLNQYKSAPDKAGDWDKMLAALNKRQNIPTAPGERR